MKVNFDPEKLVIIAKEVDHDHTFNLVLVDPMTFNR